LNDVRIQRLQSAGTENNTLILQAVVMDVENGSALAVGLIELPANDSLEQVDLPLSGLPDEELPMLEPGQRYLLALAVSSKDLDDSNARALVELQGQVTLTLYSQLEQVEYTSSSAEPEPLDLPAGGTLRRLVLPQDSRRTLLTVTLQDLTSGSQRMASASLDRTNSLPVFTLQPALPLEPGVAYAVSVGGASPNQGLNLDQPLRMQFLENPVRHALPALTQLIRQEDPLLLTFSPRQTGLLREVTLGYAALQFPQAVETAEMELIITSLDSGDIMAQATAAIRDTSAVDTRGEPRTFAIDPPVELQEGFTYTLALQLTGPGSAAVRGSAPANESSWDMGLPFRASGYDPFGGLYRRDLNFEMYWDDNPEKYQRFINTLDQADYIFISSNRQWGTTVRIPERYPLTAAYYRNLLGCPEERDIIWCYNVAEVGTFEGRLGFDLVHVETSYPNIGPLEINTQFAEEAFTVYDHPKVMIFQKSPRYDSQRVQVVLGAVDLRQVVRLTPKRAADFADMLLTQAVWRVQQAGGTWASLFPPEGLQNRYPWLGLMLWYIALTVLGWLVYPLLRLAMPGLPDRGYPLARIAGLLLLAYPAWLGGSLGLPVTRVTLLLVVVFLTAVGGLLAAYQREDLRQELRERRGYFLRVELIALAFFALGLFMRLLNPDLWHPIFGGEKPMNFSHFNAVLKSTLFPPYDPWFAGGSLNYYYYGYVVVGMPVKLLGITPSVAYNFILPSLFSMVALAAFSIAWNLTSAAPAASTLERAGEASQPRGYRAPYWVGLSAALLLLVLGNQGTVRMYWQGLQRLVVPQEQMEAGNLIENLGWAAQGMQRMIRGESDTLPYYLSDWYWKPSRAIQPEAGSEITEFPYFTFLYADLHAHMMALPITLLVIAWAVSAFRVREMGYTRPGRLDWLPLALTLLLGALALGALRPTNTWDQYTYLIFAILALAYSLWPPGGLRAPLGSLLRAAVPLLLLLILSLLLYRPFDWWFGQAYNALTLWEGPKTGLSSYFVHWGLFLFIIATWLVIELIDWMENTPLSALARIKPYFGLIYAALIGLLFALVFFLLREVQIIWVAGPLGLLAAVLLLRPDQPHAKRAVLLMVGTGLAITLAVELVAVRGDINRMNTVFKFYYQSWSLLSLSAAAALAWLLVRAQTWSTAFRAVWLVLLGLLLISPVLYPIVATRAKAIDRMTPEAPRTLDGMTYMAYTTYSDGPTRETYQQMDLNQDYRAIRWMQENVPGSPVIVEAHTGEYRHWGTRYTIYTGLPGVVGWNWHQRQQRALTPDTWVYDRIADIHNFYRTTDVNRAQTFLQQYEVGYIILGQLERIYYPGPGLIKFSTQDGVLWDKVYEDEQTAIYRVR
jgi:YYY domain-containing protein